MGTLDDLPKSWRWRDGPREPGPAVVFDLDGVLSDASARQHFLEGPAKRDWQAFFAACGEDALIEAPAALLGLLDPDLAVILLTGRPMHVRQTTVAWLDRHRVRWDLLVMRAGGSYAGSREMKRAAVRELREAGFDLRLALDDDARIVEMFFEEGVPCLYVHSGYYG